MIRKALLSTVAAVSLLFAAGQATAQAPSQSPAVAADARTTLGGGFQDAEQAASNLALEHSVPSAPGRMLSAASRSALRSLRRSGRGPD